MKINIIDNNKDFLDLKKSWDSLYLNCNCSIFQSFDFNYNSWKYISSKKLSATLSIVVIYVKNELISIFPFCVINKSVRFINDEHVDFCDILLLDEYEFNLDIAINPIISKFRIKSFKFFNLKKNSALLKLNSNIFQYQRKSPSSKFSSIKIDKGNFPDNCSNLLSKQKYEIRKILKSFNPEHTIMSSEKKDNFPINDIRLLRDHMIKRKIRNKFFLNDHFLLIVESMYYNNLIDISLLFIKSKVIAISFITKYRSKYMFWIDIFDSTKRVNIYNYISFIRHVSSISSVDINFGRGIYKYKLINFRPDISNLYSLEIYKNKIDLIIDYFKIKILYMIKRLYKRFK
tara:strand:- start:803 stop:1837 length:1035 start_codon:yes stop_codon:yes gene_type:complete